MNIKKIGIIGMMFFAFSCSTHSKLNLGSEIHIYNNGDKIFIPSGALVQSKDIIKNKISYNIGISENKIIYVSTHDKNFEISNYKIGVAIGEKFIDAKLISGWGYYVKLK